MPCFVTHLEGAIDGTIVPANTIQTLHKDRPLWVRYDLNAVRLAVDPPALARREPSMWKYQELLPLPDSAVPISLGERITPLIPADRLAAELGLQHLWIKDESLLPTGSFKSRGLAMAVNMAKHFSIRRLAIPTAGNAGGALAAYAARAGIEAFVFMPRDTPRVNQLECTASGARTYLVDGLINDCGAIVRRHKDRMGWFDCSTLKEPYRIEGKKTMGLELAEQFEWKLPDVLIYPTGGGTGLIGMWKAFQELRALGWLRSDKLPRMVSVQSDGCAPIVRAFDSGERFAKPWDNAATCASGLRVPAAVGDFMILDAIRESGGCALAVEESKIVPTMRRAIAAEGIAFCPESAACILAAERLRRDEWLGPDERVVVFNTAAAQKYIEVLDIHLPVYSPDVFEQS